MRRDVLAEEGPRDRTLARPQSIMTRASRPRLLSPIVLGLSLVASCSDPTRESIERAVQTYVVGRGDLKISIREKAEIQAAQQVTVTSKVEGRTTLIYLAPEGSVVETGERLAQLDVSSLEEKRSRQAISVAKAEAALLQARKSLEIMEEDLAAERNSAENKLRIAELEQQKFLGRLKPSTQIDSRSSSKGTPSIELPSI